MHDGDARERGRWHPLVLVLLQWAFVAGGLVLGRALGYVFGGPGASEPFGFLGACLAGLVTSWFALRAGYPRWLGLVVVGAIVLAVSLPFGAPWSPLLAMLGPVAGVVLALDPPRRRRWGAVVGTAAVALSAAGLTTASAEVRSRGEQWLGRVAAAGQVVVAPEPPEFRVTELSIPDAAPGGPVVGYQIARRGLSHDALVLLYPPGATPCAELPHHTLTQHADKEVRFGVQEGRIDFVCRRTPDWVARVSDADVWDGDTRSTSPLVYWFAVPEDELLAIADSLAPVEPELVTSRYSA